MLRILGGEFRSRRLWAPEDESVSRPMPGRVKESVFNILRGWFDGATVLDLYCGVGTIGLEAISRGAARVLFVERNRGIYQILQRNIESLSCSDRAITMQGDAIGPLVLTKAPRPADLVFLDPPYDTIRDEQSRIRLLEQICRLRGYLAEQSFVVLRSPMGSAEADFSIAGFDGPEEHDYGHDMCVLFYTPVKDS